MTSGIATNNKVSKLKTASVALALLFAACSDATYSNHATRVDAADTISRGWIPKVLPESATNIEEWHDLDLNTGHGRFRFGESDTNSFRVALETVAPGRSLNISKATRSRFEGRGYIFYRSGDFDLAIDWNHRVGEFWLRYDP